MQRIAEAHQIAFEALKAFTDSIVERKIFDGEQLSDLLAPLSLSWRERTKAELSLMKELTPLLKRMSNGQNISGLSAYEE